MARPRGTRKAARGGAMARAAARGVPRRWVVPVAVRLAAAPRERAQWSPTACARGAQRVRGGKSATVAAESSGKEVGE